MEHTTTQPHDTYTQMWEDFGKEKADLYFGYKFIPTHRVGLTNYVREQAIFTIMEPKQTDVVADIGCASGRQLFGIAKKIKQGVGTDIAQSFIDAAEAYKKEHGYNNISFQVALIESLPFMDNAFDSILCSEVLEHVHDKDVALKELIRITKPGGHLIITTPNLNADGTWWGRLMRLLGRRSFQSLEHFSKEELGRHGDAHVREFTGKSMRAWLEVNGLVIEQLRFASYFDGPWGDFLIKIPLHIPPLQKLVIAAERLLERTGVPLGRHIIVRARK